MIIEQLEDKGLSIYSYILVSEADKVVVLIDPPRDTKKIYDFLTPKNLKVSYVIETHPHADFVSSHFDFLHNHSSILLTSRALGLNVPTAEHFDNNRKIDFAEFSLTALDTPGHSPDSICVLLSVAGVPKMLFSGDTLFIGDVGRPDLRESVGNKVAAREDLAKAMYKSTREKLMLLPDSVVVYPGHGAGSLCGKALSSAASSTIGAEKMSNPALASMSEADFVTMLTTDQPFVPAYFGQAVEMNRSGYQPLHETRDALKELSPEEAITLGCLIVDTRSAKAFGQGHMQGAYNVMEGGKFETWLGSIVQPSEEFILIAKDLDTFNHLYMRVGMIGYEQQLKGYIIAASMPGASSPSFDLDAFLEQPEAFEIIDNRNWNEIRTGAIFPNAKTIPLPELRQRIAEIEGNKPVLVHCAGGYRSAAGASIIQAAMPAVIVYDLSEAIVAIRNGTLAVATKA